MNQMSQQKKVKLRMIEATLEVLKEMPEVEARQEKKKGNAVKSEEIAIEIEMIRVEAKAIEIEMIGAEVKVIEIMMIEAELKIIEIITIEMKEGIKEIMDQSALTEVGKGLLTTKKRGKVSQEMTEMGIGTFMIDLAQAVVTEIETEEDTTEHQTVAAVKDLPVIILDLALYKSYQIPNYCC